MRRATTRTVAQWNRVPILYWQQPLRRKDSSWKAWTAGTVRKAAWQVNTHWVRSPVRCSRGCTDTVPAGTPRDRSSRADRLRSGQVTRAPSSPAITQDHMFNGCNQLNWNQNMQLNGRYRKRVAVYLSRIAVIIVEGEEPVTGIQVIARLTLNTWLQAKSGKSIRQLRWVKNGAKINSSHPSRSLDLRSKIRHSACTQQWGRRIGC